VLINKQKSKLFIEVSRKFDVSLLASEANMAAMKFQKDKVLHQNPNNLSVWF